ncbi:LysR family transcriptional regulator [Lentzea sp. NBRC 102530]|uniref:LysR family transcriptional regulator n=1 Tax=Lentzea sp. NBRC 102530 TaxID=3032201 RepID=UPI0024A4E118|nr:LysR family transcriptional regulator [Lentzea sp. NBRC 102530]GLY48277.1 LysR family transcriptional regulator [Lentzea sp. NBRC 102530]
MIDPRRLRVLRALADHGTVTAAAAALHLTPSAVSQQLAALESEAGHPLLVRKGRRVSLTPAGSLLVEHAHVVAAELERAQATLDGLASGSAGRVAVAAFASAITQVVAPALAALKERSIELSVRDAEGHESVRLLLDGEIDVAITEEHRATERVTRFPLYTEPFDVLLPPGHAVSGPVDLATLADEDWVVTLPGNPLRDVVEMACRQAGFTPRIRHNSDDFRAIEALVAAGAGVALAPRNAVGGVAIRRAVAGVAPLRRVVAAVRRGSEAHPLIRAVLEQLQR